MTKTKPSLQSFATPRPDSRQDLVRQALKYLLSGGLYFGSGYLLFAALWSGLHWSLWWAKLAANVFGWSVNFILQRYWAFNHPSLSEYKTRVTGRYIAITLFDFLLDYLIVAGLKTVGVTPYLGQFASAGFFTVWNYFWYRFWVFPAAARTKTTRSK